MNAIIHFENFENVAKHFRDAFLKPELGKVGLDVQTHFVWQTYVSTAKGFPVLAPLEVAKQSCKKWEALNPTPEKTVWIFDLAPVAATSPNSSYGLCVLAFLAELHGLNLPQFFTYEYFLPVILTNFSGRLATKEGIKTLVDPYCDLSALAIEWPNLRKIVKGRHDEPSLQLGTEEPKIILANANSDEHWLAKSIVSWLS